MAGAFVLLINDFHKTEIRLRARDYHGAGWQLSADQRRSAIGALCNIEECGCEGAWGGASRILLEKTGERLDPFPLCSNRGPAIGLQRKRA